MNKAHNNRMAPNVRAAGRLSVFQEKAAAATISA